MLKTLDKLIRGYHRFREKYVTEKNPFLKKLAEQGQRPEVMVVACCDSRVDPALLLQCDPGDLFVVRNVANIIPPYEIDDAHHGTSAALEFGVCYLNVKDLIILGHSQCGGIQAWLNQDQLSQDDFISNWISLIKINPELHPDSDACAKDALLSSYQNCLTFPWLKTKLEQKKLSIHLWFFDLKQGMLYVYDEGKKKFQPSENVYKIIAKEKN